VTYLIIALIVIVVGGAIYGRRVLAAAADDRVCVTGMSPDEALELAKKKLKGINLLASVARRDNSVSRSWEQRVAKTTSTATLTVTAKQHSGADGRTTVVTMSIHDMSYPRLLFVLPLPQAPLSALKRRKALVRALRRRDSALREGPSVALSSLLTERASLERTPELPASARSQV
jgi:hypothetical protein